MILTVDIGNSNIVLGVVEDDKILMEARLRTDATKTSDEYCIDLSRILDVYHISAEKIDGAIIASVVPQVLNSMQTAIKKLTGKSSLVVGPGLKTGLNIKIENPSQTGADLVVGNVAALREHKPPLIVIDMGTATTTTVLDETGALIGGCICPGVKISLDALTSRAAQLPAISLDKPKQVIGKNTVDCMRNGMMYGTAAMIDGIVERIEKELGHSSTLIATGGLAQFITPLCKCEILLEKDLLLKGLNIIYKKNKR